MRAYDPSLVLGHMMMLLGIKTLRIVTRSHHWIERILRELRSHERSGIEVVRLHVVVVLSHHCHPSVIGSVCLAHVTEILLLHLVAAPLHDLRWIHHLGLLLLAPVILALRRRGRGRRGRSIIADLAHITGLVRRRVFMAV